MVESPVEKYALMRGKVNQELFDLVAIHGYKLSDVKKLLKKQKIDRVIEPLIPDFSKIEALVKGGKVTLAASALKEREPLQGVASEFLDSVSKLRDFEKKNPGVVKDFRKKKIEERVSMGREVFELEKLKEKLDEMAEKPIGNVVTSNPALYQSSASKVLSQIDKARDAIEKRKDELMSKNPDEVKTQYLLYRAVQDRSSLLESGHLEGEEQKELKKAFENARESGKHLFVWGETGVGKTTGVVRMFKEKGLNPIIFPCGSETTQYDLFGIGEAQVEKGGEGSVKLGMKPVGIAQAAEEDRPIILDEANALRPDVITELNPILDAIALKKKEAYIPTLGRSIKLGGNFAVVFTGNPNTEGYLGRGDIDKALSRRGYHHEMHVHSEETFHRLALALAINPATLALPEDKLETLLKVADSIRMIHQIAAKEKLDFFGHGSDPTRGEPTHLKNAVLTIQDLKSIATRWAAKGYRGGVEGDIVQLIKSQNASKMEKAVLLQVFKVNGLFKDFPYEKVKDLIDEKTWNAWKTVAKKSVS